MLIGERCTKITCSVDYAQQGKMKHKNTQKNSNVNKRNNKKTGTNINPSQDTKDCENTPNPDGQGEFLPTPSVETCKRGLETHAVVAISARDMSVGAVIRDYPPQKNVHQWIKKNKKK